MGLLRVRGGEATRVVEIVEIGESVEMVGIVMGLVRRLRWLGLCCHMRLLTNVSVEQIGDAKLADIDEMVEVLGIYGRDEIVEMAAIDEVGGAQ